MAQRRRTSTSNFGVGRREAHDARAFYARFEAPEVSSDAEVTPPTPVADPFIVGDARCMDAVADGSVALVVTSPPYFAGKQYEEELDREGVPGSYLEYLALLRDVFSECKRKLEPGGRLAVNVANLGRKPYRSLSSDVMTILQDDLRLLARGEVIWQKGDGASGSCAWGSFRSASNPVLRDITERVVIVSKGRFDRAKNVKERASLSLPHENTLTSDEFMAATLDVWNIPPESARRVDHPAPFPVELPLRLIELYTYRDDLVLDPFMGSGSTLVAAARSGRRFVGFDLDPAYVEIARRRVASDGGGGTAVPAPPGAGASGPRGRPRGRSRRSAAEAFGRRALAEGKGALALAEDLLGTCGFTVTGRNARLRGLGVTVDLVAADAAGTKWYFDVSGAYTTTRGGLTRTDNVLRSLGRAHVLAAKATGPFVLLSTHLPRRPGDGDAALRATGPPGVFDVVQMLDDPDGFERLRRYGAGGQDDRPRPGFWTEGEIA
ncbi:MAG: DNA-methyltransferase [Acidimicrobiales bacterium]